MFGLKSEKKQVDLSYFVRLYCNIRNWIIVFARLCYLELQS